MNTIRRILLLGDSCEIDPEALLAELGADQYGLTVIDTLNELRDWTQTHGLPHLVIVGLDSSQPNQGVWVHQAIETDRIPTIVLVPDTLPVDVALNALRHADDLVRCQYATPQELAIRIRRVLSRIADFSYATGPLTQITDWLLVDFDQHMITVHGKEVRLTRIENALLLALVKNRGKSVDLRCEILGDRAAAVVRLAAEKAGWGSPLPAGWGRGIAYHASWGATDVAQVVEVSVDDQGDVTVHRVVCAVDCGIAVNPDIIEQQMEGGIVFGLSAALYGEITVEQGRIQQSNFHDYPILRFREMPQVEVYIVPSTQSPTGIGEMSNPVTMPALLNAIYAATGKRIRRIPVRTLAN